MKTGIGEALIVHSVMPRRGMFSFEYMSWRMFSGRSLVRVAVIIRPPCEKALSELAELAGMEKTALK
jgi:hypothetical protein